VAVIVGALLINYIRLKPDVTGREQLATPSGRCPYHVTNDCSESVIYCVEALSLSSSS